MAPLKVAVVTGPRDLRPMGFGLAERLIIGALRAAPSELEVMVHVVGGRSARRYARAIDAQWQPARPGRLPARVERQADLVHLTSLEIEPPTRTPYVVSVADVAPLRFPDEGELAPQAQRVIERAAAAIVPSRFTAAELVELFDIAADRVHVAPQAVGHPVSPATVPLSHDELSELGLRTPFAIRLGGYSQRKGLPLLLDAWPAVQQRTNLQLALVGPDQPARTSALAGAATQEDVVAVDYLPAEVVPRLLRAASMLVSSSTYEGFGLPPLEALSAGVPVVAIGAAAVREVCSDAALYASDSGSLAAAMIRVHADEDLAVRMIRAGLQRAAGFIWERNAEETLRVYREVLVRRADRRPSRLN
jgi:glycosyltransferase involved in cell wall biosynthesis